MNAHHKSTDGAGNGAGSSKKSQSTMRLRSGVEDNEKDADIRSKNGGEHGGQIENVGPSSEGSSLNEILSLTKKRGPSSLGRNSNRQGKIK